MKSFGTITHMVVKNRKDTTQILSNYIFKTPFFWPKKSTHYIEKLLAEDEHHNGFIRDFLPKCSDFRKKDDIVFNKIENNLNDRPMKILNYLRPLKAMVNYLQSGNMGVRYAA